MKIRKLSEEKFNILLIAFSIACGLIIVISSYYFYPREFVKNQTFEIYENPFFIFEKARYPSNVEIVEKGEEGMLLGFVTDPWNLNFGIIPLGGYGTRSITLFNSESSKVKVKLKAYGEIKDLVRFEKNDFILKPNEKVNVNIFLNTTNSTRIGNYTGEIDVIIKKPRFNFFEILL